MSNGSIIEATIVKQDNNSMNIYWISQKGYTGHVDLRWDDNINRIIVDSEYLSIKTVIEIIKKLKV